MQKRFSDITVLIDIDDVIGDLLGAWCEWLNTTYVLDVKPDDITDWDISKFFPTLSKEQIFYPLHTELFWKDVKPKRGAVHYVKKLVTGGFKVFLCTTTDYKNVKPKFEYFVKVYFPFISWQQVIITSKKQMIKADFLVDDNIKNLQDGDYVKILMSAPHNMDYDAEANGMIRGTDWHSVYKTIVDKSSEWSV